MLNINATPAEVARGCRFAERFVDPIAVSKNRGTVVGTVPIRYPRGGYFNNNVANYMTYPIGGILNKLEVGIVIGFYPFFEGNDGAGHYIVDSTNGSRFTVAKVVSNDLVFIFGNTLFGTSTYATYGPYWYTNQWNVIVVTGITGSNSMYLNGNLVASNATAWTVADPATLYAGIRYDAQYPFYGYISMLKIFTGTIAADLLTQQEAMNYYRQNA